MARFGSYDSYESDDNGLNDDRKRWWVPLDWPTWLKYTIGVTAMLLLAFKSYSPISIIATFVIIWGVVVLPKIFYRYYMANKEIIVSKHEQAEKRMAAEQSSLSEREEEIFTKLAQQLFKE